jgi:hypothetical protein
MQVILGSKETEVLNAVHLSTLQPRNPETGPQSHHPGNISDYYTEMNINNCVF